MQATLIVTRDVEARYRGFLTSVMLEISPGVYIAPNLSQAVRDRLWEVVTGWWETLRRGSLVIVWPDRKASGGLRVRTLGEPPKEIVDADGVLLVRRE